MAARRATATVSLAIVVLIVVVFVAPIMVVSVLTIVAPIVVVSVLAIVDLIVFMSMLMIVVATAPVVAVFVIRLVFRRSNEIDRPIACIVFPAVLAPIPRVPRRHM
jgi:hypothetical protein